ncbi:copper chaperone PCu(A)C [Streptomyces sp. NBC_01304]|uniref:copper chaperone PCu(A)C n=1 Tax=Streptomyces sp. NBC_01304 TaxID=2903818 RepID=UPI002E143AAC|nr:copper chaperone PCu(A)C [Streptomyces sp. NBC_01304]
MNRRTTLVAAIALTGSLALAGCSSSSDDATGTKSKETPKASDQAATKPQLSVSGGFMPEPTMPDMAGGFLTITNKGAADKLTSVTADFAGKSEIHETVDQKMKKVESFDIPANGELKLQRGGNHIMFLDVKKKPKKGDKVTVELHFAKSAPIKAELEVMDATHNPKSH